MRSDEHVLARRCNRFVTAAAGSLASSLQWRLFRRETDTERQRQMEFETLMNSIYVLAMALLPSGVRAT